MVQWTPVKALKLTLHGCKQCSPTPSYGSILQVFIHLSLSLIVWIFLFKLHLVFLQETLTMMKRKQWSVKSRIYSSSNQSLYVDVYRQFWRWRIGLQSWNAAKITIADVPDQKNSALIFYLQVVDVCWVYTCFFLPSFGFINFWRSHLTLPKYVDHSRWPWS